jgi:probable HAF family extracellular repeat protein
MAQPFLGHEAFDLNNGSTVVGAALTYPSALATYRSALAVRWNLNPETLPLPQPGQESVAHAVNESGDVVGTWGKIGAQWGRKVLAGEAFPCQAFLYKNSDGVTHDLASVFGTESSGANDINDNGLIAGWGRQQQTCHAYVYNSETGTAPTNLGALPGHAWSSPLAINNKGHVVGISTPAQPSPAGAEGFHAFLYDGALKDLGPNRYAYDVNDNDQVVGDWLVSGASYWTAFLCETSSGTPQFTNLRLVTRGGFKGSVATGINNPGDIVGHVHNPDMMGQVKIRAFVRPASGPLAGEMLDLNNLIPPNSGWLLHWASAINDNRQIVGTGTYNGHYRAYLLTPDWSSLVLPEDLDVLLTEILLRAPTTSSPGLVVQASGKKIPVYPWGPPVDPWGPFRRLTPPQRDVLVGLAINVLASNINDPEARRIAEIGGLDTIRLTVDRLLGELGKSGA